MRPSPPRLGDNRRHGHGERCSAAVLIDADNAQASITEGLLAEVAKYGTAHVKRAYGDWTAPNLRGWKDQLLAQSIQPIQQFAYTTGRTRPTPPW